MKVFVGLLFLGLIASSYCGSTRRSAGSGDAAARAHLRKELFNDYDKLNIPDDVKVKFGVALISMDTDEEKGVLHTGSWLKFAWRDNRLRWDNSTNKINVLRLGNEEIWKPDITLYNSADVNKYQMMNCWDSNVVVYPTGDLIWVPSCQLQSYCNFTFEKHPFGEQECILKFGSWTFDSDILDLNFYGDKKEIDLTDFGSKEWRITGNTAVRNEKHYPCCEEAYTDLTWTLKFQRTEHEASCKA